MLEVILLHIWLQQIYIQTQITVECGDILCYSVVVVLIEYGIKPTETVAIKLVLVLFRL